MSNFIVTFEEVIQHEFEIEAESFHKVGDEFEYLANESQLNFTKGYPVHSAITSVKRYGSESTEKWSFSFADLERITQIFRSYVANDAGAACEEYIYQALQQAGCTDEDIHELGLAELAGLESTGEEALL